MAGEHISIRTEDGTAKAALFRPQQANGDGTLPGIILYMDAFGLRPALDAMAERLAGEGYIVLVPDLLYRSGPYGPFDAKTAFSDPDTRSTIMGLIQATTQDMTRRDSAAFVATLAQAGATGRIGTVGYCMGGGRAIRAAAAYPDRIAAAASIHGGHLGADHDDSPHAHVSTLQAQVYVASAGVDGSFPPEQSARLVEALRRAEVNFLFENYVGMAHGWAVPDHGAFDARGAERHWTRVLALFEEALR